MRAYIMLVTKPGTSEEVIRYIKEIGKIEGVIHADSVFGRFDAIVTIEVPNLEKLSEVVYKVIEKVPNVLRTETLISLAGVEGGK